MGKRKYLQHVEHLFQESPVVSFSSIERIVQHQGRSNYAKLLIHNLLKKNKIYILGKGCYTLHKDISLAVFCFRPAYLGLQSALSKHNLWEQETVPIIITTKKVRSGIRKIMGANVLLRRMNKDYFFGFKTYEEGKFYLPYSDVEKTLIDLIVFRENISAEVLEEFRKRIDMKKLKKYLHAYPLRIRKMAMKTINS
ncbi:hypothetical protein HYX12_03865 [Candidatus Woesearchaeota archaeon]|nr:hypothetical protein [Candidatus Woesearchaeota archaeon]